MWMCKWALLILVSIWGPLGLGKGLLPPPGAVAAVELGGWVADLVFSPDGRYLALAVRDRIELRTADDLASVGSMSLPEGKRAYALAFVDEARLAAGCADGTILLLDLPSSSVIAQSRPHAGRVWGIALSPDGEHLASASDDGTVALLWLPELSVLHILAAHEDGACSVAFSRDGSLLASGGHDGAIRLFAVPSGRGVAKIEAHSAAVWGLGFCPEGFLLSAGSDGRAVMWDLSKGRAVRVLAPGVKRVREARLRPGGGLIALATSDTKVFLWSEGEEAFIGRLLGHKAPLWAVTFSPNGEYLATLSAAGRLILWDVAKLLALRPRITGIHYSGRMGRAQYIVVSFADPNGDASRVTIDLVQGDPVTVFVSSFSVGLETRPSGTGFAPLSPRSLPAEFLIQGRWEKGAFTFGLRVDEPQRLELRIVVVDALGLSSEARSIGIEAMPPAP